MENWLEGWLFRKKIYITGSQGAGTDYQILLRIGESSGSSNYDFHLNGRSTNFPSGTNQGGDLRFTADDGTTLLDFYVEKVVGIAPNRTAYILVKVNANLDTNQSIYCYYNNPNASNYSNGTNTFLLFDDFEDNDVSDWTLRDTNAIREPSNEQSYEGSYSMKMYRTSGAGYCRVFKSLSNNNVCITAFIKRPSTNGNSYDDKGIILRYSSSAQTHYLARLKQGGSPTGTPYVEVYKVVNGSFTLLSSVSGSGITYANIWNKLSFGIYSNKLKFYVNDGLKISITNSDISSGDGIGLHTYWDESYDVAYFDLVYVRKYVDPEPVYNYSDPEEIYGYTISISENVNLSEQINKTYIKTIQESANLNENEQEDYVPSIRNLYAYQSEEDGKVCINYEIYYKSSLVNVNLEFFNGSTWVANTNLSGDYGSIELTPNEWNSKQIIWNAKAQTDGLDINNCQIKLKTNEEGHLVGSYYSNIFALDVKDPVVTINYPASDLTFYDRKFKFKLDIIETNPYKTRFYIKETNNPFDPARYDSGWLDNAQVWEYYNTIRPLIPGTWYWKVIVIDKYQNQFTSPILKFTIENSITEIQVTKIEKLLDGSGIALIYFKVRDQNNDKCTISFDYTEDEGISYKKCKILSINNDNAIIDGNVIHNLPISKDWTEYIAKFLYTDNPELRLITESLDTKELRVKSQVIVERNNTEYDISSIVTNHNISRSRQFGSAQSVINCVDKDYKFNPLNTESELNIVNNKYNPLLSIGNKIKILYKFLSLNGVKSFIKFIGKITNVEISKDKNTNLQITALDNMSLLTKYRIENAEYKPALDYVSEKLRTFDGINYYSSHTSWSEYPSPELFIGDKPVEADKYIIDYARGIVIFKGNIISELSLQEKICTNPSGDRKTWEVGMSFDNSILPKVYYYYEKYQLWMCNDYTGWVYQWTSHLEELTEYEDYWVDFNNGVINLYNALPPDNNIPEEGNIRNQKIIVYYRVTNEIIAKYYYMIPNTNDVEDIIKDISIKAGIKTSDIQDSIENEELVLKYLKYLNTSKNNIINLTLYRNGLLFQDYELDKKAGQITLKALDYNGFDKLLEDCEYLWDEINNATQELSDDKVEGNKSLKIIFGANGYVLRDFTKDLKLFNISTRRYLNFYAKGQGSITFSISYNNIDWRNFTINLTNNWNLYSIDLNGIQEQFKDIKYIKISGNNNLCYIDYIYLKRNIYTCSYTYWTLQSSGVTLSKINFNYENTDNAFKAIQDLLKNVAPNYLVYIDENNKLIGCYANQRLIKNCLTAYDETVMGQMAYSRSYYAEHYQLNLPKKLLINISEEDVYTGCLVIGKSNDPRNVALDGTVEDKCEWATGISYNMSKSSSTYQFSSILSFKDYNTEYPTAYPIGYDTIFKRLAQQNRPPTQGGAQAMNDFNTKTGMYWHTVNNAPKPNSLMVELTLERPVLWDKIDILVGEYEGKIIKQAMVIQVGDENGNFWYPDRNLMKVQPGATGSYTTWENNFNQNVPIKYVRVYCSEPWSWTVTSGSSGGKGGGGETSVTTEYHYAFAIAEILVWEKPTIIAEYRLDNVLLVGDGITNKVRIPNTPYKTKDYLLKPYGWCEKYPLNIRLYKNSLSNELQPGVDFVYDNTTGYVTFTTPPAEGDVISGTWTLDEANPDETTFYASFSNIDLIRKIGIKLYKEIDEGLTTHLKAINRAKYILPELVRGVYPSSVDVIFRPDVKIGQTVLIQNKELNIKKLFFIEKIDSNFRQFVPSMSLGLLSFLELKDYEYIEQVPEIYRDWIIHYPSIMMAELGYYNYHNYPVRPWYYTGLITIEAIDENGNINPNYNNECKLEIISIEGETSGWELYENIVYSNMWVNGCTELRFHIKWKTFNINDPIPNPFPNKWYIDKKATFKFYEINNPNKNKVFSCTLRIYLTGAILGIREIRDLGSAIYYDNYIWKNTYQGNMYINDIYNIQNIIRTNDYNDIAIYVHGQDIYLWRKLDQYTGQIFKYSFYTENWIVWSSPINVTSSKGDLIVGFVKDKLYLHLMNDYERLVSPTSIIRLSRRGWNGVLGLDPPYNICNDKLYHCEIDEFGKLYIYRVDSEGNEILEQVIPGDGGYHNSLTHFFIYNNNLYLLTSNTNKIALFKYNSSNANWQLIYRCFKNDITKVVKIFEFRNKIYLIFSVDTWSFYMDKKYMPHIAEFDLEKLTIYRKGYLINLDWAYKKDTLMLMGKYYPSYVYKLSNNVFAVIDYTYEFPKGEGNITNYTPYIDAQRREELYPNEL
jgi:hypothetical protein